MSEADVIGAVKTRGALPDRPWRSLDGFFELGERGTRVGRELIAGLTTFGSMSYILAVNPTILGVTGMDHTQLIIVTALASMFGTLIMALWANLPIALAPGMGNNAIFAQVVVLRLGLSFRVALAMVFVNSLLFMALAMTGWRERIIKGFPDPMRIGIQCGLGLFALPGRFEEQRAAGDLVGFGGICRCTQQRGGRARLCRAPGHGVAGSATGAGGTVTEHSGDHRVRFAGSGWLRRGDHRRAEQAVRVAGCCRRTVLWR